MREGNAKIFRCASLAVAGAVSLILFSMFQRKIMGVEIPFTPRAFLVPILFGGSSGLLIGIWQERLRNAMRLLTASEERYRTVTDFASDFTFLMAPDKTLRYVSPSAQRVTGYDASEFAANPTLFDTIMYPEDAGIWREHRKHHNEHGDFKEVHARIVAKNGEVRWIKHVCRPVVNERGEYLGTRGSYSDITDIIRAQQEIVALNQTLEAKVAERTASLEEATYELTVLNENLQEQRNALERANQELEAFSYSVSHDLRAPLRHINSYGTLLHDNCAAGLSQEGAVFVQRILRATQRMEGLIEALLQFSRAARAQIVAEEVDLSGLATSVMAMLSDTDPERAVSIRIAEGLHASGDRRLLEIVLQNLLGNAWKYTVNRENVLIEFDRVQIDGTSWFLVRDNGAGFNMEYAGKLFQPFQRLHGQEYEGTGIGLATVKRIVERHGGEIRAEGSIDAGAAFFFHLGNC